MPKKNKSNIVLTELHKARKDMAKAGKALMVGTPLAYLNPVQVRKMIKRAEIEGEVIVIRCKRKTPASKPGGPDKDQLYDIHCGSKPLHYKAVGDRDREREDRKNKVLTVFATNRKGPRGTWGSWRRVNLAEVVKVIYKTREYEVSCT